MRKADETVYFQHLLRTNQFIKLMLSVISVMFAAIVWGKYLVLPMWSTFQTPLFKTVTENGEEWMEPTSSGWLLGLWSILIVFAFVVGFTVAMYKCLILRDIKREQNLAYLEALIGWRHFDAKDFDGLSFALVAGVTSLLMPVFSFLLVDLNNGTKIFMLYLLTFLFWSLHGMRHDLLNEHGLQVREKGKKE